MKRHVDDLLPAYLNGTLNEDGRNRVEEHLSDCGDCRRSLEEWSSIATATTLIFAGGGRATTGSLDRVWAVLDTESLSGPKARRARPVERSRKQEKTKMTSLELTAAPYPTLRRVSPMPWLAAAAVVLIATMAAFVWYSINPGGGDRPEPMPAVQLASHATAQATGCSAVSQPRDLKMTGTPEAASVIVLPQGPYEGGLHVRPENLPTGGAPADQETVDAIAQTVSELTACMNEGNVDATWALTTDDYVRRATGTGRDLSERSARAVVPMVGFVDLETPVPEIRNAILLGDGRVGAEIRPSFDSPAGSFEYYVFAKEDGRWLIDEAVHVQDYAQIEVTVDDSGFTPREITVPEQLSELVLSNEGTTTHSLLIDGYGTRIEADPGETSTVVLKGPVGTYPFSSDIPGDDPAVFTGTITFQVTSRPEATPVGLSPDAGSRALGVPVASATIHMNAPESYAPDRLAILANRDVEVTLVNDGTLEANFTINELGISVDLEGGESETVTINAPEGAYAYYSTIPGHAQVGMSGILLVQAESGQP